MELPRPTFKNYTFVFLFSFFQNKRGSALLRVTPSVQIFDPQYTLSGRNYDKIYVAVPPKNSKKLNVDAAFAAVFDLFDLERSVAPSSTKVSWFR